jgi:hypothetical protein
MQYRISDDSAIRFAQGFYEAVARGQPVDEAVTEGRIRINTGASSTLEWGTPLLFMQPADGLIFEVLATVVQNSPPPPTVLPEAPPEYARGGAPPPAARSPALVVLLVFAAWVGAAAFGEAGHDLTKMLLRIDRINNLTLGSWTLMPVSIAWVVAGALAGLGTALAVRGPKSRAFEVALFAGVLAGACGVLDAVLYQVRILLGYGNFRTPQQLLQLQIAAAVGAAVDAACAALICVLLAKVLGYTRLPPLIPLAALAAAGAGLGATLSNVPPMNLMQWALLWSAATCSLALAAPTTWPWQGRLPRSRTRYPPEN